MKTRNFWSRREFLFQSGGGISGLALSYLLGRDNLLATPASDSCAAPPVGGNPYAPKAPHFPQRATAVISLFMCGDQRRIQSQHPGS